MRHGLHGFSRIHNNGHSKNTGLAKFVSLSSPSEKRAGVRSLDFNLEPLTLTLSPFDGEKEISDKNIIPKCINQSV